MHHKIIVKVWADDEDEALNQVKDVLEDSIQHENNTVGWDYVSDEIEQITEDKLLPDYGVKTFDELEKKYNDERKKGIKRLIDDIRRTLIKNLAPDYLSKDDAPLLISKDEELNEVVEKVLKGKKKAKKLPTDFPELIEFAVKILTKIPERDTLVMYYMEQIGKLQRCIDSPDSLEYTLQCSDNNFAEIPKENTGAADDTPAYYFLADRHM